MHIQRALRIVKTVTSEIAAIQTAGVIHIENRGVGI